MHRFYVPDTGIYDKKIQINGEDYNHIVNVLRLRVGDEITVSDGSARDYTCIISEIGSKEEGFVAADIVESYDSKAELPVKVYLFQGVPKGDKFELIIQKMIELGVYSIVPVMMERTVVKLDEKKQAKKLSRYNLISESASKQSRRGIIPEVMPYMSMNDAAAYAKENMDHIIVPYELAESISESRNILSDIVSEVRESIKNKETPKSIGIFIGPEGGFSEDEVEKLKSEKTNIITLGNRILRTETAGMMIMSVLGFMMDID